MSMRFGFDHYFLLKNKLKSRFSNIRLMNECFFKYCILQFVTTTVFTVSGVSISSAVTKKTSKRRIFFLFKPRFIFCLSPRKMWWPRMDLRQRAFFKLSHTASWEPLWKIRYKIIISSFQINNLWYLYLVFLYSNAPQSNRIYNSLYILEWYRLPLKYQHIYHVLIHKAQRPQLLFIAGIRPLNMETCLSVSKNFWFIYCRLVFIEILYFFRHSRPSIHMLCWCQRWSKQHQFDSLVQNWKNSHFNGDGMTLMYDEN